jgi:hypothetical protein
MDRSSESLRRYFYENFPDQLTRIEHSAPDGYVRHVVMKDASVEFFGIHGWKSIGKIWCEYLNSTTRHLFLVCL